MPETENNLQRGLEGALHSAVRLGKRVGKRIVRQIIRNMARTLGLIAISTTYIWVPMVALFIVGYLGLSYFYIMPADIIASQQSSMEDKVSAFFMTEDKEEVKKRMGFLKEYEQTANGWKDDLAEDEAVQVEMHALSWGVLAAVDRITHDPIFTQGKQIAIKSQEVFRDLRPQFVLKESPISVQSQSCVERTQQPLKNDPITGEEVEDTEATPIISYEIVDNLIQITVKRLIQTADTIEGHFDYQYRTDVSSTQTDPSPGTCSGQLTTITTKEVLSQIVQPEDKYRPLFAYLKGKGISNETEIHVVIELAKSLDPKMAGGIIVKPIGKWINHPLPPEDILEALDQAINIANRVNPDINQSWREGMLILIMKESSGNPRAVGPYPVFYSNKDGYQTAAGLCQLMPPTFRGYKLPGFDDIWNPVDNIIASMRYIYATSRYQKHVNNIPNLFWGHYPGY
ncbi:transglycosylase SLT domain-containing protein [Paenibacillus sp. LjRoot153]|uniref:transglycosylase SLT domain-containing protein n=1 Tax=Paenibacillus sp. LjRoot153 TaxID=3342270 RepID=UPI003ECFDCCC